jgi:DNA polymerase type B, organellar and viral
LTNYYDKNKTPIHIPKYKQYKDIKPSYFGGRVEVFKPYGENLFIYDVVSLYPHIMLNDLPIGNIIKSTDNNLNNYFGFCYATVEIPNNIYNPILPFRDELGNVYNPVGS